MGRLASRDAREHWWAVLDLLDARPVLRRALLVGLPALVIALGLGAWGYNHWARTNSVRIARQWLDANRLDRAGTAVADAIASEPGLPDSWRIASELAWKKGNWAASVEYARKAAVVGRYQTNDVLAWGEAAILSNDSGQALEAQSHLDPAAARASPRALRLAGEIDRRGRRFAEARAHFEAALRVDAAAGVPVLAADQVPLGIVCLQTGSGAERAEGEALLAKWAPDPNWGAQALRALVGDAEAHGETEAAARWAQSLRAHPQCTLGDIPVCLKAVADFDPLRYRSMLAPLEEKGRSSPTEAAQLLGWLNQIGQGAEAIRWGGSLDPDARHRPPIAPAIAEALRATQRWADLQAWTDQGDWGQELGFLQWAYGMVAARKLGDLPKAESLWRSLEANGRSSPANALFAGDSLYTWGYSKEAADLLWEAADRQDLAYQALGSLARLYQLQRDAVGQYRAFSKLNAMRPTDRDIANNFAYFAALTDQGSQTRIEHIAEEIYTGEPSNPTYRSTYAFVLVWTGQAARAMTLMEPVAHGWKKSPAVAFAYGAALAGLGRKAEAREVFDSLDPNDMDTQEADWIRAALR